MPSFRGARKSLRWPIILPAVSSSDTIEAVVFDIGGVLVDWNPAYLYRKLIPDPMEMEVFLSTVCTLEWNGHQDRGRSLSEGTAELVGRFPEQTDLIEAYYGRWEEMVPGQFDGSVALLAQLRGVGHRLFALSNWSAETFPTARHRFPFLQWFDDVVISGDVGIVKPEPAIYELAIARFRLDPSQTLFIDDSAANVEAAEAAGFAGHHFATPADLEDELDRLGLLASIDR